MIYLIHIKQLELYLTHGEQAPSSLSLLLLLLSLLILHRLQMSTLPYELESVLKLGNSCKFPWWNILLGICSICIEQNDIVLFIHS